MQTDNPAQYDSLVSLKRPVTANGDDGGSIVTTVPVLNDFFVKAETIGNPTQLNNGQEVSVGSYKIKARAPLDVRNGDILTMDSVEYRVINRVLQLRALTVEFYIEELTP